MRDVGNHESPEWSWRDLIMDPVVWVSAGGFLLCVVALIVVAVAA